MAQASERLGATLLDSIQDSLVAVAEVAGNRLLALDETALQGCCELQGHCIAIEITDLDFRLYCHPGSWGLRFSRAAPAGEAGATISGRLAALVDLAVQDDKLSTSMHERVAFHGNVALAQKTQAILAGLDIDWEEALAQRGGDLFAFQVHQGARRLGDWLRQGVDSLAQTSSEYLREEARLSPTQVEFDRFKADLTTLKHDLARAEARIQRLLDRAARQP